MVLAPDDLKETSLFLLPEVTLAFPDAEEAMDTESSVVLLNVNICCWCSCGVDSTSEVFLSSLILNVQT